MNNIIICNYNGFEIVKNSYDVIVDGVKVKANTFYTVELQKEKERFYFFKKGGDGFKTIAAAKRATATKGKTFQCFGVRV